MVVWTIMNVEHWDFTKPQPRTILPPPRGQPLLPDLLHWTEEQVLDWYKAQIGDV